MKKFILALICVLSFSFIAVNNTSAATLGQFTYDSTHTPTGNLCSGFCDQVKFVSVSANFDTSSFTSNWPNIGFSDGSFTQSFAFTSGRKYYVYGFSSIQEFTYTYFNNKNSLPTDWQVVVSFFDELNFEPCPEQQPCPECEDCNRPPFIDMVINAFWNYHTAFAGAIAGILAIFFIFRFIKARLR